MDESIRVHVVKYKDRKNLAMRYLCPLTGKHICRSTGTSKQREAEKIAAKWESELQEGRYDTTGRMGWDEFREYHEVNAQVDLRASTNRGYSTCFNSFEKHCRPKRVGDLTTERVVAFLNELRKQKQPELSEATVATRLRYLKSIARYAYRHGMLAKVPTFDMPQKSSVSKMKGRPITQEEFERMIEVTPKVVGETAAESWQHLLQGLWLTGLRLGEAMLLRWDHQPNGASVVLQGQESLIRFDAEAHKSGKVDLVPLVSDAVIYLQPQQRRRGFVFNPMQIRGNEPMARHKLKIGKIVSQIGARAGVVVNPESGKTASAHDFRRAFGARWSRMLMPTSLCRVMRHKSLETTMTFYVGDDAKEISKLTWVNQGNISGNIGSGATKPTDHRMALTPTNARANAARSA